MRWAASEGRAASEKCLSLRLSFASRSTSSITVPGGRRKTALNLLDEASLARKLWPNPGFCSKLKATAMGNKIVTEADRKASPRPAAPTGVTVTTQRGQKVSLERGSHTRSKKNPGKRPKKGG